LRCSDKIIDKGRSRAEVAALCGKPVQVDNTTPYEGAAVAIEIWIYNFGPNQLMARIRFEDGIVANIETLGYGYNEP
ncbi:MAG TPA: DUF2845 domain-containing protein, partial [Steroidobacteraceae bacterium]|nr:DUF2845 domain-containing protein [Steroidobacteraceae bacterium]